MAKLSDLTLDELYARPKITTSAEALIQSKDSFDSINPRYCESVCKLNCKAYNSVRLRKGEVDILIVQDHDSVNGKFDKWEGAQKKLQEDIIEHVCRAAGFNGLNYALTNVLKCGVTDEDFPLGKSPTATKILKCKPYLLAEIRRLKPKVILSLSTIATKALGLEKASNTNDRGKILQSEYGPVVLSLHPRILSMVRQTARGAAGLWSADYFNVVKRDFAKANAVARGQLVVPSLDDALAKVLRENAVICRSIEDVKRECDKILSLPENTIVSWDIESTGLDGWDPKAKVITTQFGYRVPGTDHYTSVVFPLFHRDNTWYDPNEAWKLIIPILTGPTKKLGWNIMFDVVYTYACTGIRARNIEFDGLLCLHLADSGATGTMSLKAAVCDFLPETGLQGYEDKLPKLSKAKPDDEEEDVLED